MERYVISSGLTGVVNTVGSAAAAALFIPLVISNIGLERYGVWTTLFLFVTLGSLADAGSSKAMVFFLTKAGTPEERGEILAVGAAVEALAVAVLLAGGLLAVRVGIPLWGRNASLSVVGREVIGAGVLIACLSIGTSFLRSILESLYKLPVVNAGFLLLTLLNYTAAYLTTLVTNDIRALFAVTSAVYGIIFVFHLMLTARHLSWKVVRPRPGKARDIIGQSLRFGLAGLLGSVALLVTRYLVVIRSPDGTNHGIFDLAVKVALLANSFLSAFAVPLFGVVAARGRVMVAEDMRKLSRQVGVNLGLYLVGCLAFFFGGRSLLGIFLEDNLEATFRYAMLVIGCTCLMGVTEPFTRALWGLGRLDLFLRLQAASLGMFFMLVILRVGAEPLRGVGLAYPVSMGLLAAMVAGAFLRLPVLREPPRSQGESAGAASSAGPAGDIPAS